MSADLMVFDKSKVPAERLLSRNMNIEIYHLLEGADQARKYMPSAEKKRRGS